MSSYGAANRASSITASQRSPQAIADAMNSLLRDAPLRQRFAAGCHAAAQALNWEAQEQALLRSYAPITRDAADSPGVR